MEKLGERYRSRGVENNFVNTLIGKAYLIDQFNNPGLIQDPHIYRWSDISSAPYAISLERCLDYVNLGPPFMTGNDLTKIKSTFGDFSVSGIGSYRSPPNPNSPWVNHYDGGFILLSALGPDPTSYADRRKNEKITPDEIPDLSPYGPSVYRSLRPKLEKAGLAVAVAEAKDIPKMMKTSAKGFSNIWKSLSGTSLKSVLAPTMQPKKVADHFINHQFGWLPFINDMNQMYDTYQNTAKYMSQIKYANNTWVRRIRTAVHQENETILGTTHSWTGYPNDIRISYCIDPNAGDAFTTTYTYKTFRQIWGVGSFKYYRPEFDESLEGYNSSVNAARRLLTLYGANVNPSVLYKVTPWTWLGDWFTNVGSTIDNASAMATDSLVAKYMYLMSHEVNTFQIDSIINTYPSPARCTHSRIIDVKHRETGSPFGFGLSMSQLTDKQLAIIAALGISRRR